MPADADFQDHPPVLSPPVLSIVIPAYNVAPYIRVCVESALAQTFRDLEVIVVDDGSTDDTPKILQALQNECRDSRLRIIRQANAGLSGARNSGIRAARGRYIGFLDGDDIWVDSKAERHVAVLDSDSSIGITFSNSEYIAEDGARTHTFLLSGSASPRLHDMIRRNHVGNGSTPVVRHVCFDLAGLFREDLRSCEDYEMWCRILLKAPCQAILIPDPLTFYRVRTNSLSFGFTKFIENSERAVGHLQAGMPNVPAWLFRSARAEHHRIAAWKAISANQRSVGLRLLRQAIRLWPYILADWRATATLLAGILPPGLRANLVLAAKNRLLVWQRPARG